MTESLTAQFLTPDYSSISGRLDKVPKKCPTCHTVISPRPPYWGIAFIEGSYGHGIFSFRCEADSCGSGIFVAKYKALRGRDGGWGLTLDESQAMYPSTTQGKIFSNQIREISPTFIEIYNQAETAEAGGLTHISGVGYRKAFEFLIKDYLIVEKKKDSVTIKAKSLGKCIAEEIDSREINLPAKAAKLVGNDETHYSRDWEGTDITDLKHYIDLVIKGIEYHKALEQVGVDLAEVELKKE